MALVLAPAVIIPVSQVGRKLRKASERSQERVAELANRVHEIVRAIRVVKAAGSARSRDVPAVRFPKRDDV